MKIFKLFLMATILALSFVAPKESYSQQVLSQQISTLPVLTPLSQTDRMAVQMPITLRGKAYKLTNANLDPYTWYEALVSQSSTTAPTATVLYNTLGSTPTYTRTAAGQYTIKAASGTFVLNKTSFYVNAPTASTSNVPGVGLTWLTDSTIMLTSTARDTLTDARLVKATIGIRVFRN